MSDDLNFSFTVDDILSLIFFLPSEEEMAHYIPIAGKSFTPTVVSELPTTGDESDLYLVPKSYTSQTASGNPITVNITDGAGKLDSAKIDGNTTQQTYTGKNMVGFPARSYEQHDLTFNFDDDGTITINGTRSGTAATNYNSSVLFNFSAGDITFTIIPISGSFSGANMGYRAIAGSAQAWYQVVSSGGSYNQGTITKTAEQVADINRIELLIGSGTAVFDNFKFKIQVTAGSDHDTNYEPYVGGQPSPNPSYPQAIHTVKGEQTVSINGTDYSIDLGSIELCKLGTYQDYIYKSGDDWKVHKAVNKVVATGSSSEIWRRNTDNVSGLWRFALEALDADVSSNRISCSDRFVSLGQSGGTYSSEGTRPESLTQGTFSGPVIYCRNDSVIGSMSVSDFVTWLGTHNTTFYYALATATDTTITDQTLIAQLEAIAKAALQSGSNTISNSASGTNLAGDLDISYHGYDPLNKYNKYIWINLDGAYEQL